MYPIYIILAYILFRLLLHIFYPIFVFIHELSHAIPALLLKKKEITITIGSNNFSLKGRLGNITIQFSWKQSHIGYTTYAEVQNKVWQNILIAAIAPLFSLSLSLIALYSFNHLSLAPIYWLIIAAAWLANTHITICALWPFNPKGNHNVNSDLSYIIQSIKAKYKA